MLHAEEARDEVIHCMAAGNWVAAIQVAHNYIRSFGARQTDGFHSLMVNASAAAYLAGDYRRLRQFHRLANMRHRPVLTAQWTTRTDLEIKTVIQWCLDRPRIARPIRNMWRSRVVHRIENFSKKFDEKLETSVMTAHWMAQHPELFDYSI